MCAYLSGKARPVVRPLYNNTKVGNIEMNLYIIYSLKLGIILYRRLVCVCIFPRLSTFKLHVHVVK